MTFESVNDGIFFVFLPAKLQPSTWQVFLASCACGPHPIQDAPYEEGAEPSAEFRAAERSEEEEAITDRSEGTVGAGCSYMTIKYTVSCILTSV